MKTDTYTALQVFIQRLVNYLSVVSMPLGNKSYTIGKSVYYPRKWCHFYKEQNLTQPNLRLVFGGLDDWSLKQQDISVT